MLKKQAERDSFSNSALFKFLLLILGGLIVYSYNNFPQLKNIISREESRIEKKDITVYSPTPGCNESQAIQEAKESVVRIIGRDGEASGFVVKPGYVLTNYHVVKGNDSLRVVFFDKTPVIGKVFNWDEEIDLAIVRVDKEGQKALKFGDTDKLDNGQVLITVGYPLGQVLPGEPTVTRGTYSAKRESSVAGLEYIQVDANLNPGNSGSPIINSCGEVVGVLSLTIKGTEGLKFGISSKTAKSISESLISTGPKQQAQVALKPGEESTLLGTVIQYYDYISTRQLDLAYGLFSNNFKKEAGGYNTFINGFNTTLNVYLTDIQIDDPSINSVRVSLVAADLVGNKVLFRKFMGTWFLTEEEGIWKLDEASINEVRL